MSLASLEPAFLLLPEKGDREFLITVRKVRLLALRRLRLGLMHDEHDQCV